MKESLLGFTTLTVLFGLAWFAAIAQRVIGAHELPPAAVGFQGVLAPCGAMRSRGG